MKTMEELLREAFQLGQQWVKDINDGIEPINFNQWYDQISKDIKPNHFELIQKLNHKLEEYKSKLNQAIEICDKQKQSDTSFEAEVENDIRYIAQKQYEAIIDVNDTIINVIKNVGFL